MDKLTPMQSQKMESTGLITVLDHGFVECIILSIKTLEVPERLMGAENNRNEYK